MKSSVFFMAVAWVFAAFSLPVWALAFATVALVVAGLALVMSLRTSGSLEILAREQHERLGQLASKVGNSDQPTQ